MAPRECSQAWEGVSPVVAILSFPSWADLTQAAGRLSAGCTAQGLQRFLYFSGAQGTHFPAHGLQGLRAVGAIPPGVSAESPVWGVLFDSHLDTLLEEHLLVETLTEYSGAPEKYPENLSNACALSSAVRGL